MRQPRVFITQENADHDYSVAETFGQLIFITRDDISSFPNSITNGAIADAIRSKLLHFDFEKDHLLFSGSPYVFGMVMLHLGRRFTKVNVLRWSNRDKMYRPTLISTI